MKGHLLGGRACSIAQIRIGVDVSTCTSVSHPDESINYLSSNIKYLIYLMGGPPPPSKLYVGLTVNAGGRDYLFSSVNWHKSV